MSLSIEIYLSSILTFVLFLVLMLRAIPSGSVCPEIVSNRCESQTDGNSGPEYLHDRNLRPSKWVLCSMPSVSHMRLLFFTLKASFHSLIIDSSHC